MITILASDELLIAKFRLKWKKVEKTNRPFMYELNQIPYDYIVKVTNRFKGLYLIYRVPEELWTEFIKLYRRWRSKPSTRKGNAGRQNDCLRRHCKYLRKEENQKAKEKRKVISISVQSSKEWQGEIR